MKIPKFVKHIYFRYFTRLKKGKCLFIPHDGFTFTDKASIVNYKADNCLIFARYLLDSSLYIDKELVIVSTTPENAQKEQEWCRKKYPDANVSFIPFNANIIKKHWIDSEFVFTSEAKFPIPKYGKSQHYIVLGYYSVALKNDYFEEGGARLGKRVKLASPADIISSSSLIHAQIHGSAHTQPLKKYLPIGITRADALLCKEDLSFVKDYFRQLCMDYTFSRILLYVPTYRDYETDEDKAKRSILGFEVDKQRLEEFLKKNELLIVCKLHPAQNAGVVDSELPRGIVNFRGAENFGLIELMKVSDMMMTDYTSAYVDYLLLDKPVIFNLYDLEKYEETRGLAFHPIERICAGNIIHNEDTFYKAVASAIDNPYEYSKQRKEMVEYLHTYHTDVCAKTYKAIFEN